MLTDNKQFLLETERLILRRFTESDADQLFELDNDPDVMRFINGGIVTPRKVVRDLLLPAFLRYDSTNPGHGFWAVIEKQAGEFLGWVSLRPTGSNPTELTLGFRFRKAAWGSGFATEAAGALLHKGFCEMGLQRVIASTYQDNWRSQRVLEKLGMKLVRKFRLTPDDLKQADTFYVEADDIWAGEDYEYVLEKSEWQQAQSTTSSKRNPI
jgi:RimJ/RimL family protein N-acetyltransferase